MRHLIILPLALFAVTSMAAKPPADHFHIPQACMNCHMDGIKASKILKQNNNSCLQCHSVTEVQAKLNRINTRVSADPARQAVKTQNSNVPALGMSVEMYSAHSRIGEQPNKMVNVPAGKFIRGTNDRLPDEGPQHIASTGAFWIDQYEVTNLQYEHFIKSTRHRSPKHFRNRTFPEGKADHPVTYVTWHDANAYCEWAGKRLPTDVEWEKAARGTKGQEYPWGNDFEIDHANMPLRWEKLGQFGDTTPVGAFAKGKSPYGAYDMTGNVWEWTSSWYLPYPGNTTASENYGERYKVLKGGSWFDCSFYKCGISAPAYNRAFFARRTKNDSFGFRCARDAN